MLLKHERPVEVFPLGKWSCDIEHRLWWRHEFVIHHQATVSRQRHQSAHDAEVISWV